MKHKTVKIQQVSMSEKYHRNNTMKYGIQCFCSTSLELWATAQLAHLCS